MTVLIVTEFASVGKQNGGSVGVAFGPAIVSQQIVNTGATTQSAAFNTNTKIVRLATDSICSVKFGTNPTATTADMRMGVNQTEYFAVEPGGGMKLAVVLNV